MLRATCPTYLKHEFIVAYMFRGPSVTLTHELPGVNTRTILDVPRVNSTIRELELSGFDKMADTTFASALKHLTNLRAQGSGCSKVGAETMSAIVGSCPDLKTANLNYTSVNPASVARLVMACPGLESLKLAGIQNWANATFPKFLHAIDQELELPNLRTLKIRQTQLGDASITALINRCPNLQSLDASFTLLKHPTALLSPLHVPPLQKLSLTSTLISPHDLCQLLPLFPNLQTLSLGALGASRGSQASISNTSAMTMDDRTLRAVTEAIAFFPHLEHISLVGNTKLGTTTKTDSALAEFISRVGRSCKRLNLAGIPSLRSADLAGLLSRDGDMASLETLIMTNASIDDEAGVYISACANLKTLVVAGTRFTSNGLFPVLNACPLLEKLDLTSCRGISVVDRRRFFEVWEKQRS
ncbi:hypothetical protein AX17_000872 [Amanita inopinata Kibby_2008]|nr:hypothetical protein AX17_000872 [Amanita inopinata Kibby_2008]